MTLATFLFYAGGAGLLTCAAAVILARSPLRGALWLIASLCHVALLFLLLDGAFVSAMQLLVYAGAIMVLFVFVIMLLNLEAPTRPPYIAWSKVLGTLAIGYVSYRIVTLVLDSPGGPGKPLDGSVKGIGSLLLTDYLFAFESVSVVLLVAVVGAVVLGLRRLT